MKKKTLEELKMDARSMWYEWKNGTSPYDLSENTDCIISSWKYEYAIFELVRIYKTFDWENDILVYSGH